MGIQDRDYYRSDARNSWGGLVSGRTAAGVLTGIYAAVFLVQVVTRTRAGVAAAPPGASKVDVAEPAGTRAGM